MTAQRLDKQARPRYRWPAIGKWRHFFLLVRDAVIVSLPIAIEGGSERRTVWFRLVT